MLIHHISLLSVIFSFLFGSFVFGGWDGDYVFTFVTTTLFISMDFWMVKNITGRYRHFKAATVVLCYVALCGVLVTFQGFLWACAGGII